MERKIFPKDGSVAPRRNYLIAILGIISIILICLIGWLKWQKPTAVVTSVTLTITPTPILTSTLVNLPVEILETGYGIGPTGYVYPYEKSIKIKVPVAISGQLSAYGVADQIIVGPKNWTGEGGVGADGSESVTLKPVASEANSGPYLIYNDDSACFSCATGDAYAFFPQAKSEYDKNYADTSIETPKILSVFQLTPKVV